MDFPGSPGVETASIAGGMDCNLGQGTKILHAMWHSQKENFFKYVVYIHNGILCSHKKEENLIICDHTDGL